MRGCQLRRFLFASQNVLVEARVALADERGGGTKRMQIRGGPQSHPHPPGSCLSHCGVGDYAVSQDSRFRGADKT